MMFDSYTKDKILSGEKTVTRRLRKPMSRRPARPGAIHKIKIARDKNVYGEILINYCYEGYLNTNMSDEEAHKEGFNSGEEYINYFRKVNNLRKDIDLNGLPIYVIKFTLIKRGD